MPAAMGLETHRSPATAGSDMGGGGVKLKIYEIKKAKINSVGQNKQSPDQRGAAQRNKYLYYSGLILRFFPYYTVISEKRLKLSIFIKDVSGNSFLFASSF